MKKLSALELNDAPLPTAEKTDGDYKVQNFPVPPMQTTLGGNPCGQSSDFYLEEEKLAKLDAKQEGYDAGTVLVYQYSKCIEKITVLSQLQAFRDFTMFQISSAAMPKPLIYLYVKIGKIYHIVGGF